MSAPHLRDFTVFLGAAAITCIIAHPGLARAIPFDREMNAMYCAPYNSDDQWGSYGVSNLSISASKYYACAVPNDSQRSLRNLQTSGTPIRLYGSAIAAQGIRVSACASYYASTGGVCGTEANNGTTTGAVTITPSGSQWLSASANDTPYLAVLLGPCLRVNNQCTGYNIVRGYKVAYVDM
jgi:hypothetical protein